MPNTTTQAPVGHPITIILSEDQAEALDAMARRLTLEPAEAAEVAVRAALGAFSGHQVGRGAAPIPRCPVKAIKRQSWMFPQIRSSRIPEPTPSAKSMMLWVS